jgi:protein associated with RNAse G/E
MLLVEYALEKWAGRPHYRGSVELLGEDEHGAWLWGESGRTIFRGDTPLFVTEHPALFVISADAWWAASWWIGHPTLELYVNINTPATWSDDRIVTVDLDLDVVRYHDGRVEVVDRDEFDQHQVEYGYPDEIIEATESAAALAHDGVVRNVAPFDGAAAREWLRRVRRV